MIDAGIVTKEQAKKSKYKNTLSQCLGISDNDVVISPFIGKKERLCDKDIFLICSDGLTGGLGDEEIMKIIFDNKVNGDVEDKLFEKSVLNGSRDNITIVLLYISEYKKIGFLRKL